MNTTIISALSRTYMVSGAANSCCADICWGNNLVSRLWLGFFAWKATTLVLIHLWRVPLLSLHKSKEKNNTDFLVSPSKFSQSKARVWKTVGLDRKCPRLSLKPSRTFCGSPKINIKTIFDLHCIPAFATLVKDSIFLTCILTFLRSTAKYIITAYSSNVSSSKIPDELQYKRNSIYLWEPFMKNWMSLV